MRNRDSEKSQNELKTTFEVIDGVQFYDINRLTFVEFIGSSNSPVFAYQDPFYGIQVAVKQIRITDDEQMRLNALQTLQLLQRVQKHGHSNLIQIFGFCESRKTTNINMIRNYCIIMELADGNLEDLIQMNKKKNQHFEQVQVISFINETVSALEHLQNNLYIAHRDIKPENILVTKNQIFQIGDLDQSSNSKFRNKTHERKIVLSTIAMMAPQLVKAYQMQKDKYTYNAYKADLYSLGLCLLYMVTLKQFTNEERLRAVDFQQEFQQKVKLERKEVQKRYGKMVSKILKLMLEPDPFKRVDFIELQRRLVDRGVMKRSTFYKEDEGKTSPMSNQDSQIIDPQVQDVTQSFNSQEIGSGQSQSNIGKSDKQFQEEIKSQSVSFISEHDADYQQNLRDTFTVSEIYYNKQGNNSNDMLKSWKKSKEYMSLQAQKQKNGSSILRQKKHKSQLREADEYEEIMVNTKFPFGTITTTSSSENYDKSKLSSGELMKYSSQKQVLFALVIFSTIIIITLFLLYILGIRRASNDNNDPKICAQSQYLFQNITCLDGCPYQFFPENLTMTCQPCAETCSQCSMAGAYNCLACFQNLVFLQLNPQEQTGVCLTYCPENYYEFQNICVQCDENCVQCKGNVCLSCKGEKFLHENRCVQQCPLNFEANTSSRVCVNNNKEKSKVSFLRTTNSYNK